MKYFTGIILAAMLLMACGGESEKYALIETDYGNIKVVLYNDTPLHRDNFVKLAKEGFYDDLLFHRVIKGFMIQGGDPDSKGAAAGKVLGMGGPDYQLDAELGKPHLRGALAAARNNNPEKKSSGSQFYIVQGSPVTDAQLDRIEQQKGITYNDEQRRRYTSDGGTPQLDMEYTVFGEVVEGMDVVDRIAVVQTDRNNRPVEDVKMKVSIVKR